MDIRVPPLGESVVEATVGRWTKEEGEAVTKDEVLVELETDKITVEVAAQQAGVVGSIAKKEGDTVGVGDLLGTVEAGAGGDAEPATEAEAEAEPEPKAEATAEPEAKKEPEPEKAEDDAGSQTSPAVRRLAAENDLDLGKVKGTGPRGRITKEDVQKALPDKAETEKAAPPAQKPRSPDDAERESRQRMSRRRQTIARRLVEAQQTTASLTTFNEVDLSRVMEIRKQQQDEFVKKNDIKLGFMSFFTKATIAALKQFPRLNGEIQGTEIVLKNYYDIGIAVGAEEGLVVPVVRDADRKSFAELEHAIAELGRKARDSKLTMEDLQGGTFTITNGGVFGSMLSTPILNPPQVGILGMHNIVQRAVVVDGEIRVRPMMYIALTYDHRMVDGSEAVRFLVTLKQMLEQPERMLIQL
ncbi:MAG TPA: 2-oxoglutarate dehydrogenase complex dihydrolipoyllysine-residue succinyltransferase [Longimicrobiaceae bacterium]|nr:2-oxoglutarate dehydrogenase complex dihydrolipoyllysine-residue succinyltransferase [Longimicrobiaceae bacterium]